MPRTASAKKILVAEGSGDNTDAQENWKGSSGLSNPLTMENENLRWAPPEEVVRLAKEAGMTTAEIVRIVSGCLPYREALKVGREYAHLLGLSVPEFMELRKNE